MAITKIQAMKAMPGVERRIDSFLVAMNNSMAEFYITTPARQSTFLAQLAHETAQLEMLSENLNYSATGLMKTWPKRFPTLEFAAAYARQPVKIANCVYANRMGNGAPETGDGWRYRGAGAFQLTGKTNHLTCAAYFAIDADIIGEWLRTPEGAMRSAGRYWSYAGCNRLADEGKFDAICDLINIGRITATVGDSIGYADRLTHYNHIKKALA